MNSPGVMDLLDKADRSLAAAEHLLADGLYLLDAFDLRNLGDYGAVFAVDDADAQQALDKAKVFCATIKTYLVSPE